MKNYQNAQQWLDQNYPLWKRDTYTYLDINNKKLQDSLKIEGFTELKKIDCAFNRKLTELRIIDSPELEEIRCQYNMIEQLDLRDFPKLKVLVCNDNELDSLDLTNNKELKELNIMSNNLSQRNLSSLKHLVNLNSLEIGNWNSENIKKGLCNRLWGSLESLKDMKELKRLNIRGTDIDEGLEYLPDSVEFFCCVAGARIGARVGKIFDTLNDQKKIELFGDRDDDQPINNDYIRDFRQILQDHKKKFGKGDDKDEKIEELKKEIKNLKSSFKKVLEKEVGKEFTKKLVAEILDLQKAKN